MGLRGGQIRERFWLDVRGSIIGLNRWLLFDLVTERSCVKALQIL